MTQDPAPQYVGFWARTCAALIDSLLLLMIILPLTIFTFGWSSFEFWGDLLGATSLEELIRLLESRETVVEEPGVFGGTIGFLVSWVLPAIAVVIFWIAKQATPGKMVFSAVIVDATSGKVPSGGQMIGRYLGYFIALFPFGLGILWVGLDKRKQGWHDKLAGTVVVKKRK
jgi:uncharacterized RDD family membrane protein YckC